MEVRYFTPMRVLALDTSTRDGSVALVHDDRVLVERTGDAERPQAERLPGELLDCVSSAGIALSDIDLFAIGAGPGSFTGLRIGIAAMQGLALVTGRRMVALSLLDVAAHVAAETSPPGTVIGVWLDAYRHEVFAALYEVTDAGPYIPQRLSVLESATVGRPDAVMARWRATPPAMVVGNGATRYGDVLAALCPVAGTPPLAAAIGRLAIARAPHDTLAPSEIQPYYVRRPDVEVARERQRHA